MLGMRSRLPRLRRTAPRHGLRLISLSTTKVNTAMMQTEWRCRDGQVAPPAPAALASRLGAKG
jgi:hypothetical protein